MTASVADKISKVNGRAGVHAALAAVDAKPKKAAKEKGPVEVSIPALTMERIKVRVVGSDGCSLIVNQFSKKARQEMLDVQMGKKKIKRDAKNPEENFRASLYAIDEKRGIYGVEAAFFKKAMVNAARFLGKTVPATLIRGGVIVEGNLLRLEDPKHPNKNAEPVMREDVVRVGPFGNRVADLRYRGEFATWAVTLSIRFLRPHFSAQQVINLLAYAGACVGICERRLEKEGGHPFGSFTIQEGTFKA
jgi:hypothetical protein